jgi:hypothetical protein
MVEEDPARNGFGGSTLQVFSSALRRYNVKKKRRVSILFLPASQPASQRVCYSRRGHKREH